MMRTRLSHSVQGSPARPRSSWAVFHLLLKRAPILLTLAACTGTSAAGQTEADPQLLPILDRFDFSPDGGEAFSLPGVLTELSGLATTPDGRVFGHNDERAVIYQLDPENGRILKAFSAGIGGVPGDFEGLAIADGRFFLITSSGLLVELEEGGHGSVMSYRTHATGLDRFCEIEGLAFDPASEEFLVPCKEARVAELENHLVVFSVPLATLTPYQVPRIFVPFKTLDDMGLGKAFNPSGIELVQETGGILILAGKQEALVEVNRSGRPVAVREFKKKIHPQPEGLAILPDHSILIGDEGQGGRGTLTRYRPVDPPAVVLP